MGYLFLALTAAAACAMIFVILVSVPAATASGASGQALPLAWRLGWPWLLALAPLCHALASWRTRRNVQAALIRADVDGCLSVGTVLAARWVCAGLTASALGLALHTFAAFSNPGADVCLLIAIAGFYRLPDFWLKRRAKVLARKIQRQLPFYLDIISLCVQAGLNLQGALQQAASGGPAGPLRDQLARVLSEVRTGVPRMQALSRMAERVGLPSVRGWVSLMIQADRLGLSLGPLLREHADQRRVERFQLAEQLAMQAPVKMLVPLIVCIFPCTFLVLGVPIALSLYQAMS